MGLKIEYSRGATPLDPDDAAGLIPAHISTQGQLNEWEYANVARGEEWAFGKKQKNILSVEFMQTLHKQMLGDTWTWAGSIRTKETSRVGIAPEEIRPQLRNLLEDVAVQIMHAAWPIEEIAARLHHRLVYIHPFPNGNGRLSRTFTDLILVQNGVTRFVWGADLNHDGQARENYIAALRFADRSDYRPLFALLNVERKERE